MYCSATIPPYCQRCWWIDFHKLVSDNPRELSTFLPRITWSNTFMFMYLQQLPSPLQHYYFWIASPWWRHQMETLPRYWPFVRGIHRSPVNSPHKGQWRGALMFSLICAWMDGWVNTREAGDWRRHRAHYDARVMLLMSPISFAICLITWQGKLL